MASELLHTTSMAAVATWGFKMGRVGFTVTSDLLGQNLKISCNVYMLLGF
jgi:hypothetical protein